MRRYEKITLILSTIALVVSLRTQLLPIVRGSHADISMQRRIYLYSDLGMISTSSYIQVANMGGREVRLGRVEMEFIHENGKSIKLVAEDYNAQDARFLPLSDAVIPVDKIFSSTLYFKEPVSENEAEIDRQLNHDAQLSTYKKKDRLQSDAISLMSKFAANIFGNHIDSANLNQSLQQFGLRTFVQPDQAIIDRAKERFEKRIARIEKGEYKVTITVFDFDGNKLSERRYRTTIYERQINELRESFDGWGNWYPMGIESEKPRQYPYIVLKDS